MVTWIKCRVFEHKYPCARLPYKGARKRNLSMLVRLLMLLIRLLLVLLARRQTKVVLQKSLLRALLR